MVYEVNDERRRAEVRQKPWTTWLLAACALTLGGCAGVEATDDNPSEKQSGVEGASDEASSETVARTVNEAEEGADSGGETGAAPVGGNTPAAATRTVWVVMKDKPNLAAANATKGWSAKGRAAYGALTQNAQNSQASLRAWLSTQNVSYKAFWVVNTVKVTADDATIATIEARSDVEKVVDDFSVYIPPPSPGTDKAVIDAVEWNIEEVRAPEAWADYGTTGEGIVVATIDTGAAFDHPALVGQYRGNLGDGSFDHDYNWFDPSNVCGFPSDTPCDNDGHGTHTMGTIAGDDGGENQIGVAPGVRWIAAKGCESSSCSFDALLSSGQWMLAPTDTSGSNPDPDKRPHIVSNSWGGGGGDSFYMEVVDSWIAAGIFPVFSNGNMGPYCGSSGSPGDYPQSYSVGAYDQDGVIAWFSSRGESFYGGVKPNISAPGVDVRSSVPGGYALLSGTSMAAPHVAGAVALLWSAAPTVQGDIVATRELFDSSAIDTEDTSCGGDAANNNVWGQGKLDVVAALELAPIGPTGYLAGTITDEAGEPIVSAKVSVTGTADRSKATDALGQYSLRLPVGGYDATVTAFGYLTETESGLEITEDATTTLDASLVEAPDFVVSGVVRDARGGTLEGAEVEILDTPLDLELTDASGAFQFDEVPQGVYTLSVSAAGCYVPQLLEIDVSAPLSLDVTLDRVTDAYGYECHPVAFEYIDADTPLGLTGDDSSIEVALPFPFTLYGETYDTVSVDTNGYVSFANPFSVYTNGGIPNPAEPNAAVYALWDDLVVTDETQMLTTVVGEAPSRKVVFEWRDVAFLTDESQRASFEIILHENGGITTQYASAENPLAQGLSATVGIEDADGAVALQYSNGKAVLRSGLAVLYEVPFSGFVQGVITDKNDLLGIAGATVTATNLDTGATRTAKSGADGAYRLQATRGRYELVATKTNYVPVTKAASIRVGETTIKDFVLKTPKGVVNPTTLELVVPVDAVRNRTLSLTNEGSAPLTFTINEAGGRKQNVTVTGDLARVAGKDPLAYTSDGLYEARVGTLAAPEPMAAGDILDSFSLSGGVSFGWGIGLADNLWVSDIDMIENVEFGLDGTPTGTSFPTPWAGYWAADMAFDVGSNTVCQLAVGGNNGIHCWDPASGDVVNEITGSNWTMTSQRGLAHKASDDTFFVGGWNEGIIYHIQGVTGESPGEVISSCTPADGDISGLAYNEAMDVLWVATNSFDDIIYELNPYDCTVLSTLAFPQDGEFQGAGLEMDGEGNLWAIAQSPNVAYLIDSGVPAFSDVTWLTIEPTEGEVAAGESLDLDVTIDTTGLEPGLYLASVFVQTNSGREPTIRIPVSLVVSGYIQGVNAGGEDYVDTTGELWAADQRHRAGSWGYVKRGTLATSSSDIAGTLEPVLYQTQRVNPYAYRFDDVPNGVYEVDLRFAELQRIGIGRRLFDVIIEDELVLPAHDIVYEGGRLRADDHAFFVEVTDGRLDVRLVPRGGSADPVINALRVTHRPDR